MDYTTHEWNRLWEEYTTAQAATEVPRMYNELF